MRPESVTHFSHFCQNVDTHQILSKNRKISVPLFAASFLLCYLSQFVIKVRHRRGEHGRIAEWPDYTCCQSAHTAAAELWFPQTLNWSLNGLLCTPKWVGRWVGRLWAPELSCMTWDDHNASSLQRLPPHWHSFSAVPELAGWRQSAMCIWSLVCCMEEHAWRRKACEVGPAPRRKGASLGVFLANGQKSLRSDDQHIEHPSYGIYVAEYSYLSC